MFGADDEPDGIPDDGGAGLSTSPPDELADPSGWLVRHIAAGDAAAEDRFVRLFQQAVLATAAVRLRDRDDAREVTDDVLMAVIAALRAGRIRDPERLPAFVRATTRNLINNRYRQRRRRPPSCSAPVEELAGPEPETELERAERERIIRRMLAELAPLDGRILELSLFSGLDAVEIASQLGLTPACVRQRKHRAIHRITARLARIG